MAKATSTTKQTATDGALDDSALLGEPLVGEPVLLGNVVAPDQPASFVEAQVVDKRPSLNESFKARQMIANNN